MKLVRESLEQLNERDVAKLSQEDLDTIMTILAKGNPTKQLLNSMKRTIAHNWVVVKPKKVAEKPVAEKPVAEKPVAEKPKDKPVAGSLKPVKGEQYKVRVDWKGEGRTWYSNDVQDMVRTYVYQYKVINDPKNKAYPDAASFADRKDAVEYAKKKNKTFKDKKEKVSTSQFADHIGRA
jgi:hypothetical protein